MPASQRNGASHRIAIDFIDPLFAVVISISFVEGMQRPWFKAPSTAILADSAFDMVVLLLGYSTVVLSWVGYHLSIRGSPTRIEILPGFLRFIFDTVLLGCYWLLLVKFESFLFILIMLVIIHWVFVVWDQLKWWEYNDQDTTGSRRRRGVSVFWAIIFTILLLIYWKIETGSASSDTVNWVFVGLGHFSTIIYRVHKNYLWPGAILDILAFHAPIREVS